MTTPSNTAKDQPGFIVKQSGMLSLIQDAGRFGQHGLGLTEGGPADKLAFNWCQRLLGNTAEQTAIEVSIGGLVIESQVTTIGCITGAETDVTLNGKPVKLWHTFPIRSGDKLAFGYSSKGVRNYFSVAGGFLVEPQFGSCATVVREGIGGLNGKALAAGDVLPVANREVERPFTAQGLASKHQPKYQDNITLRIVLGYQHAWFNAEQVATFLSSTYHVSKQWDRMGYRLRGPAIQTQRSAMYSEGITLGSVQIPADGQPIILLHDRQTIGGYPKIGTVLSLDLDQLSQCSEGAEIQFEAITIEDAHNLVHLAQAKFDLCPVEHVSAIPGEAEK